MALWDTHSQYIYTSNVWKREFDSIQWAAPCGVTDVKSAGISWTYHTVAAVQLRWEDYEWADKAVTESWVSLISAHSDPPIPRGQRHSDLTLPPPRTLLLQRFLAGPKLQHSWSKQEENSGEKRDLDDYLTIPCLFQSHSSSHFFQFRSCSPT